MIRKYYAEIAAVVLILCLFATIYATIHFIVLDGFLALEEKQTRRNVERVIAAIEADVEALSMSNGDWSAWDHTYEFIAGARPGYIDDNIAPGYLANLDLNMMFFLDANGQVVYKVAADRHSGERRAISRNLEQHILAQTNLVTHTDTRSETSGILMTPEGATLISSRPIVTSSYAGPIRGSVIFVRFLDNASIQDYGERTSVQLEMFDIPGFKVPGTIQEISYRLQNEQTILVKPDNSEQTTGYTIIPDIAGQPALIAAVTVPRGVYQQGMSSTFSFGVVLLVIGIVVAAVVAVLLHKQRLLIEGLELRVAERTAELKQTLDHATRMQQQAEEARAVAEEANETKSKFIANMSHELRTPLNAIINFTQMMRQHLYGPITEHQDRYLARVHANGEHLLGMINDILDLAKIEAGRMDLYKEPVKLGDLVDSTMSSAIGLTKGKPIELHQEIEDNLPPIEADKTRIRQVMLNLLSNAAKFTDAGSITVRVWQEYHDLITSVSDTGIGIPAHKLDTIFEEFRQADEGSDRSYQGTGLGLSICKRLIEMHNGRIWVESKVGVGSTFFFSLPLVCDISAPAQAEPVSVVPMAHTHGTPGIPIVVIEDDPAAIEIIATYLQPEGYTVYSVQDSRIALEEVRRLRPAAIILDILMPHKDGWSVLSDLKATPDLCHIPVICYTIVDDERLGLSLGASAYLVKPIEADVLCSTVKRFVRHGGYILVIDDDKDVRDIVPHYLSQSDYDVATAAHGKEGLERIAARHPDLIILDLMMPELDGFGVLEQLDQDEILRTIPVLVMTAKDLTADERQQLTQRVEGLLAKATSDPAEVLSRVHAILKRHRSSPVSKT